MVLCREWSLVKEKGAITTVEPLKCKCWHCDYCKKFRGRQLRALGFVGSPNTFLTLTVNPANYANPDERARELARAWRLLRKRAMRKYGYKSIPFLAVFERTKKGEPHLHILMRVRWLHQKWVSAVMDELTGAPIVDIRRVRGKKAAAAYVAKYVGKDPHSFEGVKRYWRSQDWAADWGRGFEEDDDGVKTWYTVRRIQQGEIIAQLRGQGYVWHGWARSGAPMFRDPSRAPPGDPPAKARSDE